jgi:catechol 2,3-dioxygenase-like lactoylglutathione lyase family enzyme
VATLDKTADMTAKTSGIRHIHLLVADLDRSTRFYGEAFGMKEKFRDGDDLIFLNTPGTHDSLALHLVRGDERAGKSGGYEHFGITVLDRDALDDAIAAIEAAGGALVEKGEHAPGTPYAYVRDPDGYIIEI